MNQDNIDIQEVLQEKEQKKKDEKYNAYVKNVTPKGRPALVKPMKSGIEEHEQNGVTVPSKAAAIFAPTTE